MIVTVPNGKGPRELFVTRPVIALQKKNNWAWKALQKVKNAFGAAKKLKKTMKKKNCRIFVFLRMKSILFLVW